MSSAMRKDVNADLKWRRDAVTQVRGRGKPSFLLRDFSRRPILDIRVNLPEKFTMGQCCEVRPEVTSECCDARVQSRH